MKLEAAQLAARIKQEVQADIDVLLKENGVRPCLAAVRVGEDPASAVYVRNKIRACEEVGMRSEHHALPASTSTSQLLELIASLNARDDVDASARGERHDHAYGFDGIGRRRGLRVRRSRDCGEHTRREESLTIRLQLRAPNKKIRDLRP